MPVGLACSYRTTTGNSGTNFETTQHLLLLSRPLQLTQINAEARISISQSHQVPSIVLKGGKSL